jgi:hypothetical protein
VWPEPGSYIKPRSPVESGAGSTHSPHLNKSSRAGPSAEAVGKAPRLSSTRSWSPGQHIFLKSQLNGLVCLSMRKQKEKSLGDQFL